MNLEDHGIRVSINPLRLDEEWVNHPQMVLNAGILVADLQETHDQLRHQVENTKANLDAEIRNNPGDYGIGKLTETIVYNTVMTQPEYLALVKKLNSAKHDLQIAQAASEALEHKKRALSNLVELWLRDYYSDSAPKAMSPDSEDFDKRAIRNRGRRRVEQTREDLDADKGD